MLPRTLRPGNSYDPRRTPVRTYLYGVVRNQCLKRRRNSSTARPRAGYATRKPKPRHPFRLSFWISGFAALLLILTLALPKHRTGSSGEKDPLRTGHPNSDTRRHDPTRSGHRRRHGRWP